MKLGISTLKDNPRFVTVIGFVLACALGFGFLWVKAGGTIPVVAPAHDYQVAFMADDIKNLRPSGDVRIAGVKVGRVESQEPEGDRVRVVLALDDDIAPLHEGATVRVGIKSLVGSTYVEIEDGDGPAIKKGAELPDDRVIPAVDVDEVYETLDPKTRASLSSAVRALGAGTSKRGPEVDQAVTALGAAAEPGRDVLAAVAAQGEDLEALTNEGRTLLTALDTGRGSIADLVTDADRLTTATSAKQEDLRRTVRLLPGLVVSLREGAISLGDLGTSLAPVAEDLRLAAPDLNTALVQLPPTTADLDGLVPDLDATLAKLPATLDEVPAFDTSLRNLVPDAQVALKDVNPMLAYLAPYGTDLGALFGNFGASFDEVAEDGIMPIRLTATAEGLNTVRGIPIPIGETGLAWTNPYPAPGGASNPTPHRGPYPRVQREGE